MAPPDEHDTLSGLSDDAEGAEHEHRVLAVDARFHGQRLDKLLAAAAPETRARLLRLAGRNKNLSSTRVGMLRVHLHP